MPHGPPYQGRRQLPQPVPPGDGHHPAQQLHRGDGELPQAPFPELVGVREPAPRLGRELAPQRPDAGVVFVPLLGQDVEGPEILGREPAVRDPVPQHPLSGGALQCFPRPGQVLAELRGGHAADTAVVVPLARDLMAAGGHLGHQLGHGVRDPAEHKEGGAVAGTFDEIQRPPRVAGEARLEAVPFPPLDQPVEGAELVVVFQRDRENMGPGPGLSFGHASIVMICGAVASKLHESANPAPGFDPGRSPPMGTSLARSAGNSSHLRGARPPHFRGRALSRYHRALEGGWSSRWPCR